MRHLDIKRIQRHFLVDGKRHQPLSHGEHNSCSALGVFNLISALNHAALAHFLFMKIEIGSECRKMDLEASVLWPCLWLQQGSRCLGAWVRKTADCTWKWLTFLLNCPLFYLPQSLLFFYSWSHEFNGSIMLLCIVSCNSLAGEDTKQRTCTTLLSWDLELKHSNLRWPKLSTLLHYFQPTLSVEKNTAEYFTILGQKKLYILHRQAPENRTKQKRTH